MAEHASLAQDFWVGSDPRLRGRRLAPFEEARVRVLFQLDREGGLDDGAVAAFLEALGSRIDVAALEPRPGPGVAEDFRALVDGAGRRWPDGIPLVVAGHGVGGAAALAAADHPTVRGVAALAPAPLEPLDLPHRVAGLPLPLLLVDARQDAAVDHAALTALATANPRATLLVIPGEHQALLAAPWADVLADWALWSVRS